jgi:hypothetical protein
VTDRVNFFQLWARRLRQALAVLRDPDAGLLLPLPRPAVDPRLDADHLAGQAREQGRADGRRYLYDGWSFGHEDDPIGSVREPQYVERLRMRRESAVHEHYDRQRLTEARMADLHTTAREAERGMRGARDRMARFAVRQHLDEDDSLRAFLRRRNVDTTQLELPPLTDPVWEGDAPPMRPIWRALIVLFLIAVVFEIEHYVAESYLPFTGLGRSTGLFLTAAVAGLTVICPLVSGQLFRNRHATGYDRPLAVLTFTLLLPTLAVVLGFGLLAAALFDHGVTGGTAAAGSRSAELGITPATVIVIFDVVLFLACAMAYIMGLAQRHPFQQAFAHNRRVRDRTVNITQRMGTRINPDYRATTTVAGDDPDDGRPPGEAPDREAAVRFAYRAAEDAYYEGLIEAVADPTFTEAVMRRRSNRPDPGGDDHDLGQDDHDSGGNDRDLGGDDHE